MDNKLLITDSNKGQGTGATNEGIFSNSAVTDFKGSQTTPLKNKQYQRTDAPRKDKSKSS